MLGVVFTGESKLEIREFADPSPAAGQVVVEMKSSGLCGSDLRPYRSSADELGPRAEVISGHEPCGVVAEVGAGVRNVRVGDRVMVHHYSGCQRCEFCETGWTQLCQSEYQKVYGSGAHGGNADYELIEDYMCVPMPDDSELRRRARRLRAARERRIRRCGGWMCPGAMCSRCSGRGRSG